MPEAQDVEKELTPAESLAAQKEGFTEANTSTEVHSETAQAAEQTQTDEAAKAEQDAAAEAAKAAEAVKEVVAVPGLTSAEVAAMVKSQLSGVYGKFGGIEQALKELRESKASGVQMTEEDVAELTKEYGPELSGALLKSINKFGQKLGGSVAKASDGKAEVDVQAAIAAAVEASQKETEAWLVVTGRSQELKMLTREHKDWRSIVQGTPAVNADGTPMIDPLTGTQIKTYTPEFAAWVGKLPETDQTKLFNSWDSEFLSEKITLFKADRIKATEDAKKAQKVQDNTPNRLKAAIVPKGTPGAVTTKSALDEQREGYGSAS